MAEKQYQILFFEMDRDRLIDVEDGYDTYSEAVEAAKIAVGDIDNAAQYAVIQEIRNVDVAEVAFTPKVVVKKL